MLALSERLADALTDLIAAAPEQWHVLEPLWSDELGSSIEGEPAA